MFVTLQAQDDDRDVTEESSFWKDPTFKMLKIELSISKSHAMQFLHCPHQRASESLQQVVQTE